VVISLTYQPIGRLINKDVKVMTRKDEWDRKGPSGCFDGCLEVFVGLFAVAAVVLLLACGGLGW
jgi:hypothetical protein